MRLSVYQFSRNLHLIVVFAGLQLFQVHADIKLAYVRPRI